MLAVRFLGAAEFYHGDRPFRFSALPRALPLLAWLVLHRRTIHQRDALAFAFWPDLDEEEARANLRRHLYAITKGLPAHDGEPWFVADKKSVFWNAQAKMSCDVDDLEAALASDASLDRVAAIYRGPLLFGLDEPWIDAERERLQRRVEDVFARALEAESEANPELAIEHAVRLLAIDPWREDALRTMLRLRHRLGDRAGALREYRLFAERLRLELDVTPMPETVAVYDAVVRGEVPPAPVATHAAITVPAPAVVESLPARVDVLIGRDHVLEELRGLLASTRCATLVGIGGVGKTRLAIELGWEAHDAYADGAFFADLAPLGEPELVVSAVAAAVGIAQAGERPKLETLVAALRAKRLFLVLDNCEHVVGAAAEVVNALLEACPGLHVLATSREPLAVSGERVYRVPSLDVPPAFEKAALAKVAAYGSVALFVRRAVAAAPGFALTAGNLAAVVEICRRLDGIALAIELAAARVTFLEPAEISRRLDERFRILQGGARAALPRQRTMRASIDWSWDLSTPSERMLLARLSIFAGGWTLEAVEPVCFDERLRDEDPVSLLGALVDRSLVAADAAAGSRRYRLLESIREYAAEKLEQTDRPELAARHAAYVAAFGRRIDEAYETLPDDAWYALAISELDNVRAALRYSFGPGGDATLGAMLASSYARVWSFGTSRDRAWLDLAYERLDRASHAELTARLTWQTAAVSLDARQHAAWIAASAGDLTDRHTRGEALRWIAEAYVERGRTEEARLALEEAATCDDDAAHPKAHAATLRLRALVANAGGDVATARMWFGRAIVAAKASGALQLAIASRVGLAEIDFRTGDAPAAARAGADAWAELGATFGHSHVYADVATRLAAYELAREEPAAAARAALAALTVASELGLGARTIVPLEILAVASVESREYARAASFFGFADAARRRRDIARGPFDVPRYEPARASLENAFEAAELARLLARGSALAEIDIVNEAVDEPCAR